MCPAAVSRNCAAVAVEGRKSRRQNDWLFLSQKLDWIWLKTLCWQTTFVVQTNSFGAAPSSASNQPRSPRRSLLPQLDPAPPTRRGSCQTTLIDVAVRRPDRGPKSLGEYLDREDRGPARSNGGPRELVTSSHVMRGQRSK
ncbi:hypothetical protein HPB48_003432 [Haemaphysalis longicornis]|uniref:Uncharacterized protein n=1 Tax=Haemaphysalis longicornis TaxID=44386 RepID=A0A9J6GBV5_HAELO|nr:hypothetical protein HPB48_003432 [Haemaphysalis longicornis]